jgi:hypothetical protein
LPWHVVPDHAGCGGGDGKFAVVQNDSGEVEACHATREAADDHVKALYANADEDGKTYAAAMSTSSINDLPDSAFAYIEPGGSKDDEGKTTPRSLRHFPIHDEAHVRNALSRAPQSPHGEKAMPKIRAAARKFGIRVSAAALHGLELARPGTYKLASGEITFTPQMLADAARYSQREGARPAPVKLGHVDKRFDGEPAMGWLGNLSYDEDDEGPVLRGDITDMPEWLAAAAPAHWPNRSVEGWADYSDGEDTYAFVVDGLALLGATPPGITSIKSLRDLPAALGVAASARIVASFGDPMTPATEAEEPQKGAGMDPAKIREALGLSADASDDEVRDGLTEAGLIPAAPPPDDEKPQPVAAAAGQPGTIVLASSVWDETQKTIKTLTDFVAQTKRNERDDVIAKAVVAGKFTPAQKPHFAQLWDADPDGTRKLIGALTPNSALAVMASGYAGEADDVDAEYAALYGDARKVG